MEKKELVSLCFRSVVARTHAHEKDGFLPVKIRGLGLLEAQEERTWLWLLSLEQKEALFSTKQLGLALCLDQEHNEGVCL